MTVTAADRKAFIELMKEVKGLHFTIGWLEQTYVVPQTLDIEDSVMLSFREQLLADKLAGNVYDKSSITGFAFYG
jgi:hypothetical protein